LLFLFIFRYFSLFRQGRWLDSLAITINLGFLIRLSFVYISGHYAHTVISFYKFCFPRIPGGSLIPAPPVALLPPTPPLPLLSRACVSSLLITTSSTRPFCRLNAGQTQTPQLHFMPCHAYRPIWAVHLVLGHSSRPLRRPCSSSGRIQESGWRKWWVHTSCRGGGVNEDIGSVIGDVGTSAGVWRCVMR